MLRTCVELFSDAGCATELRVQVLQTLSILLMNITNPRSLCE
jgi:hypothetical protein